MKTSILAQLLLEVSVKFGIDTVADVLMSLPEDGP
jgi:hypothetical protein